MCGILQQVHYQLSGRELADPALLRERMRQVIADFFLPLPPEATPEAGPRRIAFIGPTGVGKTTTIAKLAARSKLYDRQDVALITADTFRTAAAEQLRLFAEIIDVPLEVVYSTADMRKAIEFHEEKSLIYIDNTGRSPAHSSELRQIRDFVRAAKPTVVHLVLSAATERKALSFALDRFAISGVDSLVFTKLDETPAPGVILDAAAKAQKPISYITNGQNVPDDIMPWSAEKFAQEMLAA